MERFKFGERIADSKKDEFFEQYPLPENLKQYADKAWKLYQLKSILYKDNEKYKALTDFANKIEETNPDVSKYYLFQMIIGGSYEITTEFDFEGEDSIEKFLMSFKL